MPPRKVEKSPENQRRIPRQARARQKVEAVLDACTQVLARHGYHGTTVLELSLESGVAVPTLYQYFSSKEAIFVAWVERSIDQVLAQVVRAQQADTTATLEGYIDALVQVALASVSLLRPALRSLLAEMPQMLSSQVMMTMEVRTVAMVECQFADQIRTLPADRVRFHLQMLVRMIAGYFLLTILQGTRTLDVARESSEIAAMVKAYLLSANLIAAD